MNKNLFIVIVLILLFSGCYNNPPKKDYSIYVKAQESLIDNEEEYVIALVENEDLKKETKKLSDERNSLTNKLNSKIQELEFKQNEKNYYRKLIRNDVPELPNPADRISDEDIIIEKRRIVIRIENANKGILLDSNSMDPLLDEGGTVLTKVPKIKDIIIGDIVLFKTNYSEYLIAHRIIKKGTDEEGEFFITKGDNNPVEDPKIRPEQIVAVVIGIIY